eukprot:364673-Chlamydomonas_euryale.AAC.4
MARRSVARGSPQLCSLPFPGGMEGPRVGRAALEAWLVGLSIPTHLAGSFFGSSTTLGAFACLAPAGSFLLFFGGSTGIACAVAVGAGVCLGWPAPTAGPFGCPAWDRRRHAGCSRGLPGKEGP